jgi:hypothetical protein
MARPIFWKREDDDSGWWRQWQWQEGRKEGRKEEHELAFPSKLYECVSKIHQHPG